MNSGIERDNLPDENSRRNSLAIEALVAPSCQKVYELDGGGLVAVHKPFGERSYFSIVEQYGRYPAVGKIARNEGRAEYSVILEGEFRYQVDGVERIVKKGESISVSDGAKYSIFGNGKLIVFVNDELGGNTIVEDVSVENDLEES